MSATSGRIQSHFGQPVPPEEFSALLELISGEPTPADRQSSVEHLIRVVCLSPEQTIALWRSPLVRDSISLQLVVKRFAREQEYIAERNEFAARSEWQKDLELLAAISPL